MIKFENREITGWEAAIRGMRNPMNSWERSDSVWDLYPTGKRIDSEFDDGDYRYYIGPNDQKLMLQLAKGGSVHAKYRRMIVVTVDITAPLYWWKEFDTYKVGTVANSCSTMHKIAEKEFTLEDFSHEHLWRDCEKDEPEDEVDTDCYTSLLPFDILDYTIKMLNTARKLYLETKFKRYWWQMIQLLPSSYNQRRTVMMNYEVLAGIYPMRKDHKLDEWHEFCNWIKELPFSKIITLEAVE